VNIFTGKQVLPKITAAFIPERTSDKNQHTLTYQAWSLADIRYQPPLI
jgi:hypothetical protein